MSAAVGELLLRLSALGLPTTSELVLSWESPESARLRQLTSLQLYARVSAARDDSSYLRGLHHDRALLERLPSWQLDLVEDQIVREVAKTLDDWCDCITQLHRAGHPLPLISLLTGIPMKTLRGSYPHAESESPPAEPICAPASAVRN